MKPLISIIIVNWNGLRWLEKCLTSLESQTYKPFEVIIVDNNSSDESVSFVQNNFPQVRTIVNDNNYGFAKANTIGIKAASGSHILLINNDTWVDSDFLEVIYKKYIELGYDVVAPYEQGYSGEIRKKYTSRIDILGHATYSEQFLEQNFFLTGVCLFFSKQLFFETQGLDEDFFMYVEEVDWFWRLNLYNKKFGYIDGLYVYHAQSGSTGKGIKYNIFLWRNENTLYMLLKNYSILTLVWVVPLYFLLNIIEIIFFLIILKPKISLSYLQGWYFSLSRLKSIVKKRKYIQATRVVNDRVIRKKMYVGLAKPIQLINFFKK